MITVDDEKIYALYNEGRLSDLAKVGAIAGASVLGTPNTTMGDTTYNQAYASENMNVLNVDTFVDLWIKYYQTDGSSKDKEKLEKAKEKMEEAHKKLGDGIDIPSNAMSAIKSAVYIFGGDEGVSPNVLTDLLIYTGEVESLYKTRKQYEDGPARGYWQVEPKTAIDLLKNSSSYFGPKFQKMFGKEILNVKQDTDRNRKYIGDRILKDDRLAAAFAAAKWVSVSKRAGLKNIRNK
jgi:hypothetical protein